MTKHEKSRMEAAINNQYNKERRKQGCSQAVLGLLLWFGVLCFVYYCAKTI
jgi:hypothetical protein